MPANHRFLYAVCQLGAESALKSEVAREWPEFRLAFSRPGFVTFKLPADFSQPDDFDLKSVFARTYGFSLGRVAAADPTPMASHVWEVMGRQAGQHLHVWQRDQALPGEHDFEPGISPAAEEIGSEILAAWVARGGEPVPLNRLAHVGQYVWDVVLVEPGEWWVGYHQAASVPSRWPGGVAQLSLPPDMINRAYRKMAEALLWARLPLRPGDRCVELGAAPGGSAQALLARDLWVTGVDPAEMDERVLAHPRFRHFRKRAADMKRREFREYSWLVADLNVAPQYTLDAVEAIVSHPGSRLQGMILTLKLPQRELVEELPELLARIRSWGYDYVRARQLAFDRREFCVAVLKTRSMRRVRPGASRRTRPARAARGVAPDQEPSADRPFEVQD